MINFHLNAFCFYAPELAY